MKKFYYFHKISSKNINLFYTYSYGFSSEIYKFSNMSSSDNNSLSLSFVALLIIL